MSEINILALDLTTVDDSFPLIKNKTIVEATVAKMEIVPNKAQSGHVLKIGLKTNSAAPSTTGGTVPAGSFIWDQVGITPTEKSTTDDIAKRLKRIRKGITGLEGGSFGDPAQYINCKVVIEIGIQTDKNGKFPDKNVVSKYIPIAQGN